MDLATIIGLVVAIASIYLGMTMGGGSIGMYIQATAAIIVFGGTLGATMMSFSLKDNINILTKALLKTIMYKKVDSLKCIEQVVSFAGVARKEGLLALEKEIGKIDDAFLKKGIQLMVDGVESNKLADILETEIEEVEARHKKGADWLTAAGGYAPSMGIVGTVLGLIVVLANMEDPDELSKGISAAFLTTLYGIGIANLVFLPLANKLKANSQDELKAKYLQLKGILGIQSGANPRIIEEELTSFIAPKELKSKNGENNSSGTAGKEKAK